MLSDIQKFYGSGTSTLSSHPTVSSIEGIPVLPLGTAAEFEQFEEAITDKATFLALVSLTMIVVKVAIHDTRVILIYILGK